MEVTTTAGTCRFCSCTTERACDGGCTWVDEEETICSRCAFAETLAMTTLPVFASLAARVQPGDETTWLDLTPRHRQLLVLALRALQEGIAEALEADLAETARASMVELHELGRHLIEKFPEERARVQEGDESIVDVTIRLLNQLKPAVVITG